MSNDCARSPHACSSHSTRKSELMDGTQRLRPDLLNEDLLQRRGGELELPDAQPPDRSFQDALRVGAVRKCQLSRVIHYCGSLHLRQGLQKRAIAFVFDMKSVLAERRADRVYRSVEDYLPVMDENDLVSQAL